MIGNILLWMWVIINTLCWCCSCNFCCSFPHFVSHNCNPQTLIQLQLIAKYHWQQISFYGALSLIMMFLCCFHSYCLMYLPLSTVPLEVTSVTFVRHKQNNRIYTTIEKSQMIRDRVKPKLLQFSHRNTHPKGKECKEEEWRITDDKKNSKCEQHSWRHHAAVLQLLLSCCFPRNFTNTSSYSVGS